jgi:PUA-domain protein
MVEEYLPAKRHLKDKEVKQILKEFTQRYPLSEPFLRSVNDVQEQAVGKGLVFFLNRRALFLRTESGLLPSLKFDELLSSLPKIVVDMGAVAHVANGAHVMRPGIKVIPNDFRKGDLLLIVDEKFGKNIALGIADVDSNAMKSVNKGKVIENIHYVGDDFWKSFVQTE